MSFEELKLNKKTAVIIILAAAVVLAIIVFAVSMPFSGAGGTDGRIEFLSSCGWQADPASEELREIVIPREFSDVMEQYNALQKQQGYDLTPYAGLSCTQCTYKITNYPTGDSNVYAVLIVYGSKVIAGDIHSNALDGFMHAIK